MAYKMKGSSFYGKTMKYGKNNVSPFKQLAREYMRTPEEEALYKSPEGKYYEPVPMGTYRSPGAYSKYTGPDVVEEGYFGPEVTKKAGDVESYGVPRGPKREYMGPTISEEEAEKRYKKLPPRPEYDDPDFKEKLDKRSKARKKLRSAEYGTEIKKEKKEKKESGLKQKEEKLVTFHDSRKAEASLNKNKARKERLDKRKSEGKKTLLGNIRRKKADKKIKKAQKTISTGNKQFWKRELTDWRERS